MLTVQVSHNEKMTECMKTDFMFYLNNRSSSRGKNIDLSDMWYLYLDPRVKCKEGDGKFGLKMEYIKKKSPDTYWQLLKGERAVICWKIKVNKNETYEARFDDLRLIRYLTDHTN